MTEKTEDDITKSHWLNWCRLCAKDDLRGNVKVYTGENANTWNSVLVMAIRKYFNVHMRLEDELSGVLCKECYTLISELIDFAEHVNKVQAIFETLRCSEPSKKLDVEALRLQYGLREEDWTHIIKPVLEFESKQLEGHMPNEAPKQESVESTREESVIHHLPIEEITIPAWNTLNHTPNKRLRGRRRSSKVDLAEKITESLAVQKLELIDSDNNELPIVAANDCSSLDDELEFLPASPGFQAADSTGSEREEKPTRRRKLECKWCTKIYHNPASYKKHLRLDCRKKEQRPKLDKSLYCKLCSKTLSSAAALKQHQEGMHDNAKPYVCDHCGKQLKTITALNEHKLVHTEERPFACAVCRAAFKNKARLKIHYQIHEEPNYVCNICGKKLQTRRTWNMHKLVHSEDRKFKCDVCDAHFKRSKTLKRHLLSHTGLRPYVCNYCDKTFACNANCRNHQLRKHPHEFKKQELTSRLKVPTLNELRVMSKVPNTQIIEINVDSCS